MTDHGDQLREAFQTHENLAPDPAAVYARVQELSRSYLWRRRGAQVAGGAVLGVGLIAGAVNFPTLPGGSNDNATVTLPAFEVGAAPAPSVPVTPSAPVSAFPSDPAGEAPPLSKKELEQQKQWDAYFGAGYDYDDAVELARIWKSKAPIGDVKAEAGKKLLAGADLPIEPGEGRPSPDSSDADPADPLDMERLDAFFAAGYDYDDAVRLADLWNKTDPYEAKVTAGQKILAGETLPIRP